MDPASSCYSSRIGYCQGFGISYHDYPGVSLQDSWGYQWLSPFSLGLSGSRENQGLEREIQPCTKGEHVEKTRKIKTPLPPVPLMPADGLWQTVSTAWRNECVSKCVYPAFLSASLRTTFPQDCAITVRGSSIQKVTQHHWRRVGREILSFQ